MANVDEIIEYIKSLKKGFDKELFQSKIDELDYLIESDGLNYKDFHTLFTVWLNLNIPIPKWMNLGICIVPHEKVKQDTVEYSLRWILANYDRPNNATRTLFLLDWLTAAMDTDLIDMNALDIGYEIFYTLLTFEALTVHVTKLVYTLTKPADVTRRRVLELINLAKKREGKKNVFKQLQVLLGLFKSYKPQCVPEAIPSISIHTVFRKINAKLLTQFIKNQSKMSNNSTRSAQLFWTNPLNSMSGSKKLNPLVPNMEFVNIGSQQDNISQKNYLDFSEPVTLLQYSIQYPMRRPSRLRALLCNPVGLTLLVMASDNEQVFLSHDLRHLLSSCFLETSSYSYVQKQDFLQRLVTFQSTLLQGVPVVTQFLAQFLPFWNEKDFFGEILKLVEWVNVENEEHIQVILDTMAKIYYRSQPLEQCAILNSVTAMYTNLVYASTRQQHYFLSMSPSEATFENVLTLVGSQINDMSDKGLQISPESMCVMYSVVRESTKRARFEAQCGCGVGAVPRLLTLALPLLSVSAITLDAIAELIMIYKIIFSTTKAEIDRKDQEHIKQKWMLKRYTLDFIHCFFEQFLSERKCAIVFNKLSQQIVNKLNALIPDADSQLCVRNHLAFAPYTYLKTLEMDVRDTGNKIWFHTVLEEEFQNLALFVRKSMPELH